MLELSRTQKSYFRGAIWVAALVTVVLLPKVSEAQDLSEADKTINNVVTAGLATGKAPTEWLGATPHFVMVGAHKDFSFDIEYPDLTVAKDFTLFAKREYRIGDDGKLRYIDFEVAVNLITNGIERGFEFEFENADFSGYAVPTTYALKDAEFPEGQFSNMELQVEWEWVEKSIIVNEETLYTDGSLTVAHDEGTPVEDGTSPNGMIGGFVTGTYEGKPIAISFTAPVTEAEIDD